MGAAAAVVIIKEQHIVEAFERLGATTAERARTLDELGDVGVHAHGLPWLVLRDRVIIREAEGGRYYVDLEGWKSTRRRRRRALFVVAVTIVAASLFMMWRH